MDNSSLIPIETISQKICIVRGVKVMLDADLAELYGVLTKNLNLAVQRNSERFPDDFVFQLSKEEFQNLRLQNATSSWGGRRSLPYVFTEHGVAMLSSVLRSARAVQMNIFIIRAFVKLRELLASNKELAFKVEEIMREQLTQNRHINAIYRILDKLIEEPVRSKEPIGFRRD